MSDNIALLAECTKVIDALNELDFYETENCSWLIEASSAWVGIQWGDTVIWNSQYGYCHHAMLDDEEIDEETPTVTACLRMVVAHLESELQSAHKQLQRCATASKNLRQSEPSDQQ